MKLKQNEILAISALSPDIKSSLTPFFDFPRKQESEYKEAEFKKKVHKAIRQFQTHLSGLTEIYLDTFDLSSSLQIDGDDCYKYLLQHLSLFPIIPTVSIDRSPSHIRAVEDSKEDL